MSIRLSIPAGAAGSSPRPDAPGPTKGAPLPFYADAGEVSDEVDDDLRMQEVGIDSYDGDLRSQAAAPIASRKVASGTPPGWGGTPGPSQPEGGVSGAVSVAYLRRLAALAVELGAQATGRCDPAAIRMLRQRLTQWIEDLRSAGGDDALARAVEELVERLSKALAAPASLAAEAAAISEALARLATGAPPPEHKGRPAFWK